MNQFSRTELLLGPDAMRRLSGARVAVFGVGGVGGYVAEALARSGIGALDLIDNDTVKTAGNEPNSPCRQVPGSTAFVPAVAGLIIAGEVVKDIAMIF